MSLFDQERIRELEKQLAAAIDYANGLERGTPWRKQCLEQEEELRELRAKLERAERVINTWRTFRDHSDSTGYLFTDHWRTADGALDAYDAAETGESLVLPEPIPGIRASDWLKDSGLTEEGDAPKPGAEDGYRVMSESEFREFFSAALRDGRPLTDIRIRIVPDAAKTSEP